MKSYYNAKVELDNGVTMCHTHLEYYNLERQWVILSAEDYSVFYSKDRIVSILVTVMED